jgi:hypothetical protein
MNIANKVLAVNTHIVVNKWLAENVGLDAAYLFSVLVDVEDVIDDEGELTDGWFEITREDLKTLTTLDKDKQIAAEKKLIDENLILIKQKDEKTNLYKLV